MIFVDVSHLHDFLRVGKPLSGIQRVTLNSLIGLERKLGMANIRAMIFSQRHQAYCCCTGQEFLRDKGHIVPELEACTFTNADKVLLSEYFWNPAVTKAAANRATFNGAKIFRFIHDVIPIALPKLFAFSWVWKFKRFVRDAIDSADVVLTNSDYSKTDLIKFFPKACADKPVEVLKLPHEFVSVDEMFALAAGAPLPPARLMPPSGSETLMGQDFVVMVGSFEARKNPQLAVKAWAKLASKDGSDMPKLVMVGAYTSHSWLYKRRLRRAIENTPSILHLPRCDDDGLKWLYQNCRFTIFLSAYEGWGLPVGESLWFGKPVVASNATSIPEVGGGLVDYVDPISETALMTAIERLCFDDAHREARVKQIANAKLRTWKDATKELCRLLG